MHKDGDEEEDYAIVWDEYKKLCQISLIFVALRS